MFVIEQRSTGSLVIVANLRSDFSLADLNQLKIGIVCGTQMIGDGMNAVLQLVELPVRSKGATVAGPMRDGVKVAHDDCGTAIRDATEFGIGLCELGQMTKHEAAPDHVKFLVRQRQLPNVANHRDQIRPQNANADAGRKHLGT